MRVLQTKSVAYKHARNVAYGRTGRRLVSAAYGHYFIWDLETFQLEQQVHGGFLFALRFLFVPGGREFLEANRFWGRDEELPAAGSLEWEHLGSARADPQLDGLLCFGPGGRSVLRERAGPEAPRLALWDFAGNCLREYPWRGVYVLSSAAFSPDGASLAYGPAYGDPVSLVGAATAEVLAVLPHTDRLYGLTFAPDGRRLATFAGRLVRLWSVPGGVCVCRFRAFRRHSHCAAFSPDGRLLAAGSQEGRVRVWEAATGRELADHDWGVGEVRSVAFSPDGLTAAAVCKEAVVVWDVDV